MTVFERTKRNINIDLALVMIKHWSKSDGIVEYSVCKAGTYVFQSPLGTKEMHLNAYEFELIKQNLPDLVFKQFNDLSP